MPIYMTITGNFSQGNGMLNFACTNNLHELESQFKGKVPFKSINKVTINWGDGQLAHGLLLPAINKIREAASNPQQTQIIAVLIGLLLPYMEQGGGVWISGTTLSGNDLSRLFCVTGVPVQQSRGMPSLFDKF